MFEEFQNAFVNAFWNSTLLFYPGASLRYLGKKVEKEVVGKH